MINRLKHKVIISCQAMPTEPLYKEECMFAMMQSVVNGGAEGLRVAGARDVKMAKTHFNIPVIGLTKPEKLPENWREVVYITPTINDIDGLIEAGADIIAFDGTSRKHVNPIGQMIEQIKSAGKLAMADISTLEEGLACEALGVDLISTTLSGYTTYSPLKNGEPDFELLKELVSRVKTPVILEGRIWKPEEVSKAFDLGAWAVVIGSAVTRPQLIVERFIKR